MPDTVMMLEAGFVAAPNLLYAEVLKKHMYPEGSAVDLCLRQPEVVEAAKKYPYLNEIEITYGLIKDRWRSGVPFGFHIQLELGSAPANDQSGQRLFFTIESYLDPVQDWSGQPLQQDFSPSAALGEIRCWGGSEWGP